MLKAHMERDTDGIYWRVVDSEGRIIIDRESYQICANIESRFNNPRAFEHSEAQEIADAHHAALRQWGRE